MKLALLTLWIGFTVFNIYHTSDINLACQCLLDGAGIGCCVMGFFLQGEE